MLMSTHVQHVLAWISLSASSFFCFSSTSWAASLALRSSTYQGMRQGDQEVRRMWLADTTEKTGDMDEWTVDHNHYTRMKQSLPIQIPYTIHLYVKVYQSNSNFEVTCWGFCKQTAVHLLLSSNLQKYCDRRCYIEKYDLKKSMMYFDTLN